MLETPKASYILNSARDSNCLQTALENLRSIKRADEEFIVVYAGSDDVSSLRTEHDWIDQWIIEKDRGEAHGLNKGLLAARGVILRPLCDEDDFYESVIHEAIDLCIENEADVVFTAGKSVDPNGRTWEHSGRLEDILQFKNTSGLALCFRRSIIPLVGLLDARFIMIDVDFICRLLRFDLKVEGIDKIGFVHNRNETSTAVRFAGRDTSDRQHFILSNSDIYLGPERILTDMIPEILQDREYAEWLGAHITQGLLHYSEFKRRREGDDEHHPTLESGSKDAVS
jgi:hypothetical protein